MNNTNANYVAQPTDRRRFFILSSIWLMSAVIASQLIADLDLWFLALSIFGLGLPVGLAGLYTCAVSQTKAISYYQTQGRLYKIFSKRWLKAFLWFLWAFPATFLMLLQFASWSAAEWCVLALSLPLFLWIYQRIFSLLAGELKKHYLLTSTAINWSRVLVPLLMVSIFILVQFFVFEHRSYDSLASALELKRDGLPDHSATQIVQIGLRFITLTDGFQVYLASQLSTWAVLVICGIATFGVFFNVSATLSFFVIPKKELRRAIGPLTEDETPAALPVTHLFISSFIFTLVTFFIYLPSLTGVENWIRTRPVILESLRLLEQLVEMIDGENFQPGTLDQIRKMKTERDKILELNPVLIDQAVDKAFAQAEQGTDRYLDWYYSLPAEYTRIAKMLVGELETYLEEQFLKHLEIDDGIIKEQINQLKQTQFSANQVMQNRIEHIKDSNRVQAHPRTLAIAESNSSDQLLKIPPHLDAINFHERAGASLAAGGAGSLIGKAIVKKVVAKGIVKSAASALLKVLASKAGGSVVGAGVGATVGSIIPGLGTVVGGVIGAVVGGIAVDAGVLKLEEVISREKYKKELLEAIWEQKRELKASLQP